MIVLMVRAEQSETPTTQWFCLNLHDTGGGSAGRVKKDGTKSGSERGTEGGTDPVGSTDVSQKKKVSKHDTGRSPATQTLVLVNTPGHLRPVRGC